AFWCSTTSTRTTCVTRPPRATNTSAKADCTASTSIGAGPGFAWPRLWPCRGWPTWSSNRARPGQSSVARVFTPRYRDFRESSPATRESQDQHRVAVAIEAVALADRLVVGAAQQLVAAKGAHQNQQRRTREMKIRQQNVDAAKLVGGADEERRLTFP